MILRSEWVKYMKVLITTDLFTVTTNGVVTSVRNLMEELEKKGHDVRVLTFSEDMKNHKEGNVYYIKSIPLDIVYPDVRMPMSNGNALVEELIAWKPDVIHSQCEFFSYHYASRIAKHTGAPLVHTYHTMYEQYVTYVIPSERIGKKFVRFFIRNRLKDADVLVAPTRKVKESLEGYDMKNKIRVVPSGISLKQHNYRLTQEERKQKRLELGIPQDHTVLLNLGRLGTEKNLGELVELFSKALKQNQRMTFLIVGDGPDKAHLEQLAEKLEIQDRVIFTGMVPPSRVQEYYQLADLFVSASTSETQGLTYIEAAANGLPLLCRQDMCLCDIIEEGVNGYQYTGEADFLERLQQITADAEWCRQAGMHSEEIAKKFDKSYFADTIEDIYEIVRGADFVEVE